VGESLAQFNQRMQRFYDDLEQDRLRRLYGDLGDYAQGVAKRQASADVGSDVKFSGWAPVLETKLRFTREAVIMSPTRSSAGPWTVAESGRNQGNAGGFAGPGLNSRTGAAAFTKKGNVRRRKARRWNGRTEGKGTASRTVTEIERNVPPRVNRFVVAVTRKHFD
jgi:hypothetical protein